MTLRPVIVAALVASGCAPELLPPPDALGATVGPADGAAAPDAREDAASPLEAPPDAATGGDASDCPEGERRCRGECVDTSRNPVHCGACGASCRADETCRGGRCESVATPPDAAADAASDAAPDASTVVRTCRVNLDCANPPNGSGACAHGWCGVVCHLGAADCDDNPENGCETRPANDPANCGACGRVCDEGTVCTSGRCAARCDDWFLLCGGRCVDANRDPMNCGRCGRRCAGRCANAVCE